MTARIAGVLFLLCSFSAATAQEEMVTDRPDATESPVAVLPGRVQIEMGTGDFSHDDEDGIVVDTAQGPATLIRVGLVKRLELRLGWAGWIEEKIEIDGVETEVDGVGDTLLGFKLELAPERGRRPQSALLVHAILPTGDDEFTSDRIDPEFRFSMAHTLTERLGLGYNLGMVWNTETDEIGDRDTLSSYLYTVVLGIDLGRGVGTYVELFGEIPASASGGPANTFDGGFTFLARDNLQFSIFGGVGVSAAANDSFAGIGLTFRLPN